MQLKPSLFVGSSAESLPLAYAVHENLMRFAEVTVWDQGLFELSKVTMEQLLQATRSFDFACFLFSPDDVTRLRGRRYQTARDNVVFELGLFMAALGRDRVFFLFPDHGPEFRLPTDLLGLTGASWETRRRDDNLNAALGPACNRIRRAMRIGGQSDSGTAASSLPHKGEGDQASAGNRVSLERLQTEVAILRSLSPLAQALILALEDRHVTPGQLRALKRGRLMEAVRELRTTGLLVALLGKRSTNREGLVYWFSPTRAPLILEALVSVREPSLEIEDIVEEELERVGYEWTL